MIDASADAPRMTIIGPSKTWPGTALREVWVFRDLFYFLTWRDVKIRYKQTILGPAWAILQPLLAMVVFTIFFGAFADVPSDGHPYPLFSYVALVPWYLYANGLTQGANSLVASQHLLTKVYFPRLIIPLGAILGGLVDFVFAFTVVLGMLAWYGYAFGVALLAVIPLAVLALVAAAGPVLWLSALNMRFRDVKYVVPFLSQIWLFASPVIYPASVVPTAMRAVYALNPMVTVVEGTRWAVLGSSTLTPTMVGVSITAALAFVVTGWMYFRRSERVFADVV